MMDLNEYQITARSTAIYLDVPNTQMIYPALGIVGECGEVAEKVKKLIRDDNWNLTEDRKAAIAKELGDCCWYLANICSDLELELSMMYYMRSASMIHGVRTFTFPQLTVHMNSYAIMLAGALNTWHRDYDCCLNEHYRFPEIPNSISELLTCIEEMATRCERTLEEVYIENTKKLARRKKEGKLKGEGDNR